LDDRIVERRGDPRRGIVIRVGLVVAATGIVSAAIDRRALAGAPHDVPIAVGFGLFLGLLLLATLRRPMRGSTWLAFGSMALVYVLAAAELASGIVGMLSYVLFALAATLVTAPQLRPLVVAAFCLWTPALWLFGPTPALDAVPAALRIAAVGALAFTVIVIASPARTHPSDRLRRAGYGLLAIAVVSASMDRSLVVESEGIAPGEALALFAVIALPILAFLRIRTSTRELLATAVALVAFAFIGIAYIIGKPYHTDVVAVIHRAAELFVAGQNPYATLDLPEALARFQMDPELATHLLDGTVVHTFDYPALSFLLVSPFVWLGLDDIRAVYLVETFVIAILAIRQLKPVWRSMALATVVGNEIITRQWIAAGIDPSWALLVLVAWLVRERRWWSSICFGLAIADRQPAWFVTPFFLLAIAEQHGGREALRRGTIALGVAILVMAPFVIGAPERTISGIFLPIFAPLVSDGVGLMRYDAAGFFPHLDRVVYTAVSIAAVVGLLFFLWRHPKDLAGAPLVWPFLPLYLAWRSLQNYFAAAPLFALIADEELADDRGAVTPPSPPAPRT
jgi:Glycosyltransferase family 87